MTDIVFRNDSGVAVTTSMMVAETFGKAHLHVVRDIDELMNKLKDIDNQCYPDLDSCNTLFETHETQVPMPNGGIRYSKYYSMNRDGFTLLAMGYTGKKALAFKLQYIAAFNAMEQTIRGGLQQSINALTKKQIAQMLLSSEEEKEELMQRVMDTEAELDAVKTDLATRVLRLEQQHTQPVAYALPKEEPRFDRFPREGIISSYKALRLEHPDFMTVDSAAILLTARGLPIRKRTLYRFLEACGFLSTEEHTYHRPSRLCVDNGWMVCTSSGGTERYPKRRYHIPHLSPAFVDVLEERIREERTHK